MTTPNQRLGQLVATRRKQLGLTLDDVQAAGGPSDVTTSKIEKGVAGAVSARTLRKLDVSLRWNPGTAARIIAGSEQSPLEMIPKQESTTALESIDVPCSALNQLIEIVKRYDDLADENGAQVEQLRTINDCLAEEVAGCVQEWVSQRLGAFPSLVEGTTTQSILRLIRD